MVVANESIGNAVCEGRCFLLRWPLAAISPCTLHDCVAFCGELRDIKVIIIFSSIFSDQRCIFVLFSDHAIKRPKIKTMHCNA